MSFILDALKKSESDRQRQNGPALYEVKVAAPRTQLPLWAIGLAVLLAINLGVVAWALLRRSADAPAVTAQSSGSPAGATGTNPPVAAQNGGQPPQALATSGPGSGPGTNPGQGYSYGQNGYGQNGPGQNGYGQSGQNGGPSGAYGPSGGNAGGYGAAAAPSGPQQPGQGGYAPGYGPNNGPNNAQGYSPGYPQNGNSGTGRPWQGPNAPNGGAAAGPGPNGGPAPQTPPQAAANPDDYAPATDAPAPSMANGFHARTGLEGGMQLYSDAEGANGLPDLRLDLLTYSENPRERFVLINMKTVREGEMVTAGLRLDSIRADGVILSRNGAKYLLAPR
ncbi:MAG TPA: general secretion pathway protein GspB [Steroidobacteraceae bacterium]|jgi:hypothetical protein